MWKILYKLSSPKFFYSETSNWINKLQVLTAIFFVVGLIWGLFFVPADYQQGDAFRIIYLHVPCAFFSMGLYTFMGFLSLLLLIWRIKIAGVFLINTAKVGTVMTGLALITGSIWGKPMWGAWWVWDARLTSELILLLIYCSILVLHYAYKNKDQADRVISILTLVGVIDLPIIHYSVYWWNTLHQGATLTFFSKPKIAVSMAYPLFIMLAAFCLYCILIIIMKTRTELLIRERKQRWVSEIL